jgi:hypothetical protein
MTAPCPQCGKIWHVPQDPAFRTLTEWSRVLKRDPKTIRGWMDDPIPFPRPIQIFGKNHAVIPARAIHDWIEKKLLAGSRANVGSARRG